MTRSPRSSPARTSSFKRRSKSAVSVWFGANQGSVELVFEKFEFPKLTTGTDANWVVGEVILMSVHNRGAVVQPVFFRTDEMAQLRRDLVELLSGERIRLSTAHIEEQFGISIKSKGELFTIAAWVSDHEERETLGGLTIDRTELDDALGQLADATAKFPVRGEPF